MHRSPWREQVRKEMKWERGKSEERLFQEVYQRDKNLSLEEVIWWGSDERNRKPGES